MQADGPARTRAYHHGSLAESLVEAGVALARPEGPTGLGLRAASRAAGVSHNAAYRHFADHDALLAAVGARCMRELALRMESGLSAVTATDPVERAWGRLRAIGRAYVEFALAEPGWFRTAFSAHGDPTAERAPGASGDTGRDPYQLLGDRLDDLVEVGAVGADRRPGLEYAAWSAVHGLACLLVDGPLRGVPAAERERALEVVLGVVSAGLSATPPDGGSGR